MKKLIAVTMLVLLTSSLVPTTFAQKGVSCDDLRELCRNEADIWYYGCVAQSGPLGFLYCWPASEDRYQTCVSSKSNGSCSIFH